VRAGRRDGDPTDAVGAGPQSAGEGANGVAERAAGPAHRPHPHPLISIPFPVPLPAPAPGEPPAPREPPPATKNYNISGARGEGLGVGGRRARRWGVGGVQGGGWGGRQGGGGRPADWGPALLDHGDVSTDGEPA
jgi:hypothetical protein